MASEFEESGTQIRNKFIAAKLGRHSVLWFA